MPCNYKDYPSNWQEIRSEILARADNQCEWVCDPEKTYPYFIRCVEINGDKAIWFKGKVVLTIAHLCFVTKCDDRNHLRAMCQLHHNRYDAKHRAANRKRKRESNEIK